MRRIAVIAVSVALLLTGCASASPTPTSSTSAAASSDTLMVSAPTATLTSTTLAMNDAHDVVWMADRPTRTAGSYSAASLQDLWTAYGFTTDEPNAILTGVTEAGVRYNLAVVVSAPNYSNNALTFTISPIDSTATISPSLQRASLVIDGTNPSSNCSNVKVLGDAAAAEEAAGNVSNAAGYVMQTGGWLSMSALSNAAMNLVNALNAMTNSAPNSLQGDQMQTNVSAITSAFDALQAFVNSPDGQHASDLLGGDYLSSNMHNLATYVSEIAEFSQCS